MSGNFLRKIPQNFQKIPQIFSSFSKLKNSIVFVANLVKKDYIDQNLVKVYYKTPKNVQFLLKTLNFSIFFGDFGDENLKFYVPKTRYF